MKDLIRNLLGGVTTIGASVPWWWVLSSFIALLGPAGSAAATAVTGWLSPVLLCASVVLMGRSFWVLYVRKIGTRATKIITWASLVFMVCFWAWFLATGGWQMNPVAE